MKNVQVSSTVGIDRSDIVGVLDPTSIVRYTGTYEVQSREETDEGVVLNLSNEAVDMAVEFTELDNGYRYEQVGDDGPFEEMWTSVTVHKDYGDVVRVTARSTYTFGSIWAFLLDRLAAKTRRRELRRLVSNLLSEVECADARG